MVEWIRVLEKMVDGPTLPITGRVESQLPDGDRDYSVSFFGQVPVVVGIEAPVRLWRHGLKLRAELPSGEPVFRCDGVTSWDFGSNPVLQAPRERVFYGGPGRELMFARRAEEWRDGDFSRPTDKPIIERDYLSRPCWEVELAPPEHKPAALTLVVDQETGAVLEQGNAEYGYRIYFTEFEVIDPPTDDFYRWDGEVLTVEERDAAWRAEAEADRQKQIDWFADNIAAPQIRIQVPLDLSVDRIYTKDKRGGFELNLSSGSFGRSDANLARRPRSPKRWNLGWNGEIARWSTAEYDWAFCVFDHPALQGDSLTALQKQLHPEEPVEPSTYPVKK